MWIIPGITTFMIGSYFIWLGLISYAPPKKEFVAIYQAELGNIGFFLVIVSTMVNLILTLIRHKSHGLNDRWVAAGYGQSYLFLIGVFGFACMKYA
jgi:hypothetical protein